MIEDLPSKSKPIKTTNNPTEEKKSAAFMTAGEFSVREVRGSTHPLSLVAC